MPDSDITKNSIAVWEKTVDVQMHFNDLCMRLRSFAISILGVLIGASALSFKYAGSIALGSYVVSTSSAFLLLAMIIWGAFFLMDRYWYHELLKGSVAHGMFVETELEGKIPDIKLAHTIRDSSHSSLSMKAAKKLNLFYGSIFSALLIAFTLIMYGVDSNDEKNTETNLTSPNSDLTSYFKVLVLEQELLALKTKEIGRKVAILQTQRIDHINAVSDLAPRLKNHENALHKLKVSLDKLLEVVEALPAINSQNAAGKNKSTAQTGKKPGTST